MQLKRIEYQSAEALLVKYYRLLRNLSQPELADIMGCSDTFISQVENGQNITRDTRIDLANALDCEPWQLCKLETTLEELIDTIEKMDIEFKDRRLEMKKKRWERRRRDKPKL